MSAINYAVSDDWGSGFVGTMTVPGGTQGLEGWTIEFDASFAISSIWGAQIVSHTGDHYVIRNLDWNASVAAGGEASFGFQATPGAGGTAAGGFVIDGASSSPPPVLPTPSVESNPGGSPAASGWFSTSGNQIVDAAGHPVQIAGVNWFGFESSNLAPHGLWARGYKDMMDQMVSLGFNTIRLPFSDEMLHSAAAPNGIDFAKNPDLQGLSALQIMDKIVDYAGQVGLRIILDHHRSDSGAGTSANGLWYDARHSQAEWVSDWQMLAQRYSSNPAVIGADLHNEPFNGTWGGGGPNDWAAAAELAGNAIGTVNPNWLIFVEGIGTYQGQSYWWGGNLMGVKDRPIVLSLPDKLVYSAHDYPDSVYPQPWFQGSDFPANLPAKFDQMWGYIYKAGIAPVYLGEFGTNLVDPKDAPWLKAITAYLSGDFNNDGTSDIPAGQQGISWTFWSWNPDSGDTGGILADDWNSVNQAKLAYLKPIEFNLGTTGGGTGHATVTEVLVADTGSSSSDRITANPAVTGAGDPNAVVTISEGSSILGTTTADGSGNWTFTPTLADGPHTLVASETNAAGTGTASLTFILKTSAPPTPYGLMPSQPSGGSAPVVTGGGEIGDTVTLYADGTVDGTIPVGTGTVAPDGTWSVTTAHLSVGAHSLFAIATDIAGNTSATSAPVAINVTTVDFGLDGTVNPPQPSDTTINGGLIEVRSGESAGLIGFTGGGTLQLDDSVHFTGKISGFAMPDQLDLRDISFGAGTTLNFAELEDNTQGTLTVGDGTNVVQIIMAGQYVTGQFNGASDGHGGTVITDPPLTASAASLIGTGGTASSAAIAPQPAAITVPDGNAAVTAQSGPEIFDFSNLSFGNTATAGFDPTQDALPLKQTQVDSFSVVRNDIFSAAGGMLIALDPTHSITVNGVAPASAAAANFTSV